MRISLLTGVAFSALLATSGLALAQGAADMNNHHERAGASTSTTAHMGAAHMGATKRPEATTQGRSAAEFDKGKSSAQLNRSAAPNAKMKASEHAKAGANERLGASNRMEHGKAGANERLGASDQMTKGKRSAQSTGANATTKMGESNKTSTMGKAAQNRMNEQNRSAATGAKTTGRANERMGAAGANRSNPKENAAAATNGRQGQNGERNSAMNERGGKRLDPQQQRRVADSIRTEHVRNISHVDFNVAVGTVVPTRYRFHPLPRTIVDIYPEYRGDQFILVNDRIVIVEPHTHRIVRTIDEYRTAAMNEPARDCR